MTDFFYTDTMIGRLRRACHGKLLWHDAQGAIPTNGRFVFYELEQDGAVPKNYPPPKKRRPAQDISDALIDLRRAGHVPWDWIVDETRELVSWRSAETVAEYMRDTIDRARINAWNGEPAPLIICEARSTKGVLERIAGDYLAPITATNGQCGGFLRTDVAPHLISNSRPVLYIGDHEVGGPADSIEANTQRVLEDYCERPIEWTRIALTQTQDRSPVQATAPLPRGRMRSGRSGGAGADVAQRAGCPPAGAAGERTRTGKATAPGLR